MAGSELPAPADEPQQRQFTRQWKLPGDIANLNDVLEAAGLMPSHGYSYNLGGRNKHVQAEPEAGLW